MRYPVAFAALCGLLLAVIGTLSGGQTYGTGYEQARGMVEEHSTLPPVYALLKLAATVVSYVSGIPAGFSRLRCRSARRWGRCWRRWCRARRWGR